MFISGYTMHLYCDKCNGNKWEPNEFSDYRSRVIHEINTEGPKCYAIARRKAKLRGWILKKNGDAVCPKCNPKNVTT